MSWRIWSLKGKKYLCRELLCQNLILSEMNEIDKEKQHVKEQPNKKAPSMEGAFLLWRSWSGVGRFTSCCCPITLNFFGVSHRCASFVVGDGFASFGYGVIFIAG